MTLPKLSDKQSLFVEAFTNPMSATFGESAASARRAGYRGQNTATRLLSNPDVKQHLEAARAHHAEARRKASQEAAEAYSVRGTLDDFQSMYEEARGRGELSQAIKAKELIGKHLRMFTDRLEVDNVSDKSPEELRTEIDQLLEEMGYSVSKVPSKS